MYLSQRTQCIQHCVHKAMANGSGHKVLQHENRPFPLTLCTQIQCPHSTVKEWQLEIIL